MTFSLFSLTCTLLFFFSLPSHSPPGNHTISDALHLPYLHHAFPGRKMCFLILDTFLLVCDCPSFCLNCMALFLTFAYLLLRTFWKVSYVILCLLPCLVEKYVCIHHTHMLFYQDIMRKEVL